MATITAEAKLYNGWRLLCVDKNITANITATFTTGNYNRPSQPEDEFEISSGILAFKVLRTAAGIEAIGGVSLTDERYATYGGGNRAGVINPAQPWTISAGVACKFPTYVRFDLEALGVPEGTDLVLQMEEGFVIEGDYPGTERKPLSKVSNLLSFRTPKKFAVYPSASASVSLPLISRTRPFNINVLSLFSPNFTVIGNFAGDIDMYVFSSMSPTPNYAPGLSGSTMSSFFGPTGIGGLPEFDFPFRTRLFESNISSELTGNFELERIRTSSSDLNTDTTASATALQYIGVVAVFIPDFEVSTDYTRIRPASAELSAESTVSSIIGEIEQNTINLTSSFSTTANISYTVRSNTSSMSVVSGTTTQGNYTVVNSSAMNVVATCEQGFDLIIDINTNLFSGTTFGLNFTRLFLKSQGWREFNIPSTIIDSGNYTIFWGDGTSNNYSGNSARTHTYATNGTYRIRIRGDLANVSRWTGNNGITSIVAFGESVKSMYNIFDGYTTAPEVPALLGTGIVSLTRMFENCPNFNSNNVIYWDTSNVVDLDATFSRATNFNRDISGWNTSNVVSMRFTFEEADYFNQPIGSWDVSKVESFDFMFAQASGIPTFGSFNQPLNNWDVSSAISMVRMFANNNSFNQPLNNWNVSKVQDFTGTFLSTYFNQDINSWDVSSATTMRSMFEGQRITNYTASFSNWDVSNVTDMSYMFANSTTFNGDITAWDVSNVTNMEGMFSDNSKFNRDIGNWNVSSVTNMTKMFSQLFTNYSPFNQDLSGWCVTNIPTQPSDFAKNATNWTLPKPVWGTCPP